MPGEWLPCSCDQRCILFIRVNYLSDQTAGILEREQEQSVVYGSIDFGKTIVTHDKYKELVSVVLLVRAVAVIVTLEKHALTLFAHSFGSVFSH